VNRILAILLLQLSAQLACGQKPDSVKIRPIRDFYDVTGLTAYYFWEEDSSGNIRAESLKQPFLQNFQVQETSSHPIPPGTTYDDLRKAIHAKTHDPKWDPHNRYFFYRLFRRKMRLQMRTLAEAQSVFRGSYVYRKTPEGWETEPEKTVLYFTEDEEHCLHFSHSSDSLILPSLGVVLPSNGFYRILCFQKDDGTGSERVFNYNGTDLTDSIAQHAVSKPVRMLLFVNGYRGPAKDDDPADGLITRKDRYYYWYKIDDRFQEVLKPDVTFYMDGSFPIATSNHRTKLRFGISWIRTKLTPRKKTSERIYRRLNTQTNPEGFQYRVEQGRMAGEAFLLARSLNPGSDSIRDTIDIVCHSMGYACTLGFLDVVKDHVIFGNMYIMAPENAGAEGFDWQLFAHTWQYGSNCDQPNRDPLRAQDGIAPQCAVKGLDQLAPDKGGRVFFPEEWPGKNFVDSHMVYSYDWMFDCIPEGEPGYIQR